MKNNNYYKKGREIVSTLILSVFAMGNIYDVMTTLFAASYLQGLLYLGGMAALVSLSVLLIVLYKRYKDEKTLYLQASDFYLAFKFVVITMASISGNFMPVCAMLFYESFDVSSDVIESKIDCLFPKREGEESGPVVINLIYFGLYPLALLIITMLAKAGSVGLIRLIYATWDVPYMFEGLAMLPYWLSALGTFMLGAYVATGSIRALFTISDQTQEQSERFQNPLRNFSWILIAFLIASPTIFLPIVIYGWHMSLLMLSELLGSSQYMMYVLSYGLHYCIQPLVEEIACRALLFRFCAYYGLCDKDYTKMNWKEKILYSILNGLLFAFLHQRVRKYTMLSNFVPLFMFGVLSSMLTFLNGRIDLSTFEHAFHNMACQLCPRFVSLWFIRGLEFTRFISPVTSGFTKYITACGLESIFVSHNVDLPIDDDYVMIPWRSPSAISI